MRCESETDRARTGFQLAAQFAAGSFLLSGDTGGDHVRLPRQRADQRGAFRIPVRLFECCQAAHVIPGCWLLVGGNVYLGAGTGISACVHRDRGGSAAAADSGLRLFPRLCGQLYGGVVRQAGRFDGRRFFRTAVSDYVSMFFLLAVPSWEAAVVRFRASFGRGYPVQADSRRCWLRLIGVCLTLCLGIWLDLRLSPVLLQALLERIF